MRVVTFRNLMPDVREVPEDRRGTLIQYLTVTEGLPVAVAVRFDGAVEAVMADALEMYRSSPWWEEVG